MVGEPAPEAGGRHLGLGWGLHVATCEPTPSGAFPGHADGEGTSEYERGRAAALAEVMTMLRDMRAREAAVIAYWRTRGGEDGHVFKLCDRQLTLMTLMSLIDALKDKR